MRLRGLVYDPSEVASKTCDVDLFVWGRRRNMMTRVIYGTKLTAKITKIYPNWGSVAGGTTITITGVNFSSRREDYSIIIDGVVCKVKGANEYLVRCVTGKRTGLITKRSFKFNILGRGLASNEGCNF